MDDVETRSVLIVIGWSSLISDGALVGLIKLDGSSHCKITGPTTELIGEAESPKLERFCDLALLLECLEDGSWAR